MKHILILGSGGMVGHILTLYFKEQGYRVSDASFPGKAFDSSAVINIRELDQINSFLNSQDYDVIINCIALLVKESGERKADAIFINSFFPQWLSEKYANTKTKIIHMSSFGVFDGINPPFNEDSPHANMLFYARSKSLGEIKNDKDLTVRSDFFGIDMNQKGVGLLNWFLTSHGELSGFTKAMFTGVSNLEFAHFCEEAIKNEYSGVYNLTANECISKHDLLKMTLDILEPSGIILKENDKDCLSFMCNSIRTDIPYKPVSYDTMLHDLKAFAYTHKELYKHYNF